MNIWRRFVRVLYWAIMGTVGGPASLIFIRCDSHREDIKLLNSWVRKGMFKTRSVDLMCLGVVRNNTKTMALIADTVAKIQRVFTIKEHPRKLRLSSGTIYALANYGTRVHTTTKRNSLIFNYRDGKLYDCNINNIFMLPNINDELQGIIEAHNDSEQIEAQERKDTKDDYREYVKAISEMVN